MGSPSLFHLAFPVHDLKLTRDFYVSGLGCVEGRGSDSALILGLAGHQIVAHLVKEKPEPQKGIYPRHFGLIFHEKKDWQALLHRARQAGLPFYGSSDEGSRIRHPGERTEHLTFFLVDPSNNLLEFKHYTHASAIFGERESVNIGDSGTSG